MGRPESIMDSGTRPQWQWATVESKTIVAPDTMSIVLRLEFPLQFAAGQYVNVRVPVEGHSRPVQRAYSIGSPPPSDLIEIVLNRADNGIASPVILDRLQLGDRVELRGPHGRFHFTDDVVAPLLLVGAGTGVVPFLSMVRHFVSANIALLTTVLQSSRSAQFAIAHDEMQDLARRHHWLDFRHTFTRAPGGDFDRRIDSDMLKRCGAASAGTIFVCGSPGMVKTTLEALEALDVTPTKIQTETY